MKLFQTSFNPSFIPTIREWSRQIHPHENCAIFHIYAPYNDKSAYYKLDRIQKILSIEMPGIPVVGCSATGEIINGMIDDNEYVITLTAFEKPGTKVSILSSFNNNGINDSNSLLKCLKDTADLKGIEIIVADSDSLLEIASTTIDKLPEEIDAFGAVAVGDEENKPFIFTDDIDYHTRGVILVLYSGKELHIQTNRMFGWKAIGYPLHVTKVEGQVVYELDGKPAYDVYSHYLHIKKGSNFFYDALEFPWEVQINDDTFYIRHAKSVNPDGSIVMSTSIPLGSSIRLSYGDPIRIVEHTKQTGSLIRDFAPDAVTIYNCMGRKLFWSGQENIEIAEISKRLNTTGFSALGEIMRYKGTTVLNNLSIVTVAMREGEKQIIENNDTEQSSVPVNMPITARLAIFINTITEELMEKNHQLNDMLYKASHDALTGLLNRGAIERIIYEADNETDWFLIMFDIDDFKQINDSFGHTEGDNSLKVISHYLTNELTSNSNIKFGRWGGEEFVIFIKGHSSSQVQTLAEKMNNQVTKLSELKCPITISVGATKHLPDEGILQTINRVDELLYAAKNNGKNQVCSDL